MLIQNLMTDYRLRKQKLDWFDLNCWLGAPTAGRFSSAATASEMRAVLADHGIHRAVLSHTMARDYDPVAGTEILVETIRDDQRFLGAAVIAPDGSSGADFRDYIRRLIAARIRIVRVFPKMHNFVLSPWCFGPWLSVLEELRIPLVVWHTETTWDAVASVCERHPRLPVIVESSEQKLLYHNRVYSRLLDAFDNFHLEIHNLTGYLGLDDLVRRHGSKRLLFGSGFPLQDPNAVMMLVTHGDISDEDRRNIAHANLERLLGEVETP